MTSTLLLSILLLYSRPTEFQCAVLSKTITYRAFHTWFHRLRRTLNKLNDDAAVSVQYFCHNGVKTFLHVHSYFQFPDWYQVRSLAGLVLVGPEVRSSTSLILRSVHPLVSYQEFTFSIYFIPLWSFDVVMTTSTTIFCFQWHLWKNLAALRILSM